MDTWLGLNHLHTKRVSKLRVRNILSLMVRELGCTPATERRDYFGTLFILLHLQRAVVGEVELALKKKSVCVCVCVCACLCQKQKANKRQVEGDISSDVRRTAAEGYKKKPYSQ